MVDAAEAKAAVRDSLEALAEPIKPVRMALTYQVGLAAVALAMVLLPLVYVGLIILLGFGVFLYAVHAPSVLFADPSAGGGRGWLLRLLLYVGPLVGGGVTAFFMVKPFFAPRGIRSVPLTVDPEDQVFLHRYVQQLCDCVGAPRPSRIDVDCRVNASASFRRGLGSFVGSDVVLTIGLPLAAGMSLRSFTGILAHELGHFAQGGAMRLTYVIRSVSHWFARVVYERDAWDQKLEDAAAGLGNSWVQLVLLFVQLMVYLSRRVLWVLMMIGHIVSGFMLRQMEFDADRYEARIAGSDDFARGFRRITELSIGDTLAHEDLRRGWGERRLGDNFPAMIVNHAEALSDENREKLWKEQLDQKTGWFASHPSTARRIKSVEAKQEPGRVHAEAPARVIFRDFTKLSRIASAHYYQLLIGDAYAQAQLVPVKRMAEEKKMAEQADDAAKQYLGFELPPLRLLLPDYTAHRPSERPAEDVERYTAAQRRLKELRPEVEPALETLAKAEQRQSQLHALAALRRSEMQFDPATFNLTAATGNAIAEGRSQADQQHREAQERLKPIIDAARQRLTAGLRVYHAAVVERHPKAEQELDGLLEAADALGECAQAIDQLALDQVALGAMLQQLQDAQKQPALVQQLLKRAEDVAHQLGRLQTDLTRTPYPFEHGRQRYDLGLHLVPSPPPPAQVGVVHDAAGVALERYATLGRRVQSSLIGLAERAEEMVQKKRAARGAPEPDRAASGPASS